MKNFSEVIEEALEPALSLAGAQIRDIVRGYENTAEGLRDELALANREIERLTGRLQSLEGRLRGDMPKRRGRPPKDAAPEGMPPPLKRKRGRPPKVSVAPQGTLKGQPKRGPGRPRKVRPADMEVTPETTVVKRPRGRPRKVVPAAPPPDTTHQRGRTPEEQGEVEAQTPAVQEE